MLDGFLNSISHWMQTYPLLAIIICFSWGVCSVVLSPCQLATISILANPKIISSTVRFKIQILMLGHIVALFAIGFILIFFSYQLDFLGHYWTVPFGILFLYMTRELLQHNHCSHCSTSAKEGVIDKLMQYISQGPFGFFSLGFGYGVLSSSCVLIFLAPVLFIAKDQNFYLLNAFNAAFAIGHTLPIFIVSLLAKSIHKIICASDTLFVIPRRLTAFAFTIIGIILIAHPFLELMGFDFHGHGSEVHGHHHDHNHGPHDHNHDDHDHNHDGHEHENNVHHENHQH